MFEQLKNKLPYYLKKIRQVLTDEKEATFEMLTIYRRYLQGKATQEEMHQANEQFRSLLKTAGLGIVTVLPLAPITIPMVVALGKKLGIDVLPKSFEHDEEKKEGKDP